VHPTHRPNQAFLIRLYVFPEFLQNLLVCVPSVLSFVSELRTHHHAAIRGCEYQSGYGSASVFWRTVLCLNDSAPSYLAESICRVSDVQGRRHLRSSAATTLTVPPVRRSTVDDRGHPCRRCTGLGRFASSHPSYTVTHQLLTRTEDIPSMIRLCRLLSWRSSLYYIACDTSHTM